MKNNTVVTIADHSYFWGALLLAASMRRTGMDEPLMIFQQGFSEEMKKTLLRLPDVSVIELSEEGRNLTCRKPEVMLLADSEYVTWVDADGYFSGCVSDLLIPTLPGSVHLRLRSPEENNQTFRKQHLYEKSDSPGAFPSAILARWREDVQKYCGTALESPACETGAVACILSFRKEQRDFLEIWKNQMDAVLPKHDVGVVDSSEFAYRQLDESVLNSLLCFLPGAPIPDGFRLDKIPDAMYRHVVGIPKPWEWWTDFAYQGYYREIMEIVAWLKKNNPPDIPFPSAFDSRFEFFHRHGKPIEFALRGKRKLARLFHGR